VTPELIAVTGDLTHRGRRREHERAATFLRGFGKPLLVVPGNHDIPYTFRLASRARGPSSKGSGRRSNRSFAPRA
jgi:3',5'-cyclic AMP phosphodiesterase CpdA